MLKSLWMMLASLTTVPPQLATSLAGRWLAAQIFTWKHLILKDLNKTLL
jgi:hypothetical protein